ncbi:MAG: hypothetical protein K0R87_1648 [Pseudonocardia sp.]|nr:hypothetical protein [Pseudonocardia sp.]
MTAHTDPDRPADGRHTSTALRSAAVAVDALTDQPVGAHWVTSGRHRARSRQGHPGRDVAPRGALLGGAAVRIRRTSPDGHRPEGYDGLEVYAAASLARRSARDTIVRLAQCKDRVATAARAAACTAVEGTTVEGLSTGAAAVAGAAAYRIRAIEHADATLVDALDNLDASKAALGEADRTLRQYHPHGGTLVVTVPTRRLALGRLEQAIAAATTRHHLADSATYALVKAIVAGERAVRAVDGLVEHVLDQSVADPAAAPPPFLRLVRAALPRSRRLDWWRELCSLFAECEAAERRAQAASQLLHAPRMIWTSWSADRRAVLAPRTEDEQG